MKRVNQEPRNAREAWAYVVKLAADILAGTVGQEWCSFENERSERLANKARRKLVADLDRRASRLARSLSTPRRPVRKYPPRKDQTIYWLRPQKASE
jgi:hypothetical protein